MPATSPTRSSADTSTALDAPTARAAWLDVFRGFTMVCLIAEGFGLIHLKQFASVRPFAEQFDHVPWDGLRAWDLVQPFFMFIVGVAMPLSFGRRWAAGQSWGWSFAHVVKRCALLVLWGLIARSILFDRPTLDLINVLAQIAFTYFVAFLVLRLPWTVQALVAVAMLAAHWAFYRFFHAPGIVGPWVRDANPGWWLDAQFVGRNAKNGYAVVNCVAATANTIAGVMAGQYLLAQRGNRVGTTARRLGVIVAAGAGLVAAGLALSPWVPVIKKIWTASFALVSIGITLWALVAFYALVAARPRSRLWALFVIVGSNSIFLYLFNEIFRRYLTQCVAVFTQWRSARSEPWGHFVNDWIVLLLILGLAIWLHRRRVFFKL